MKAFRVLDPNLPDLCTRGFCGLAVMTKAPQAGRVKTRLVPLLTPEEAAELNKCFLRDTAVAISLCCSGGLQPLKVQLSEALLQQLDITIEKLETPSNKRPIRKQGRQ